MYLRMTKWVMLAFLAPELVMSFACGRCLAAKHSVKDMKEVGAAVIEGPRDMRRYWGIHHSYSTHQTALAFL
jgi:hypothetical protein